MDLNKAQLIVQKIERLIKTMQMDASFVSPIEKDLLRNYVQQLYESLFFEADTNAAPAVRSKPEPPPKPVVVIESKKKAAPKIEVKAPAPVVEEKKEKPVAKQVVTPPPPPEYIPKPEPPVFRKADVDADSLFELEQVKELADKLGEAPITDLNKAFSINDRIYYLNELFHGNNDAFTDTLRKLNGMPNFEQAKDFLIHDVANTYQWTSKERKAIAKGFIKTVRRRFTSMS